MMTERDPYYPMTLSIVRGLSDKLYEKRKAAALEIEKIVRELMESDQRNMVEKLLGVLASDFALSHNQNTRKGGIIGLAAVAIALEKEASMYVNELVRPVMASFYDSDSRLRYYACESLYNIAKITRGAILIHFNDIFDNISKLVADPDQNVKKGIEILDRLLKDIVAESSAFDLVGFIPHLRERIYTKNAAARMFIVSWVSMLDSVPDINMIVYLPEILDGLFSILSDPNQEIKKICESTLIDFLRNLRITHSNVDYSSMTNILIIHSHSTDNLIQYTAVMWLKEFVQLAGRQMLQFASGIINSILPCLSYDEPERKYIREAAKAMNHSLKRLIGPEDDVDVKPEKSETQDSNETTEIETPVENKQNISLSDDPVRLNVKNVLSVVTVLLNHKAILTRISALRWLWHLLHSVPNRTFQHIESLFPALLEKLSDESDDVVLLVLESLAEISSNPAGYICPPQSASFHAVDINSETRLHYRAPLNDYFIKFINKLMSLFRVNHQLLCDKGSFIIRQLTILLNAEDIFRSLSMNMLFEEDLEFATTIVRSLSTILLTSAELFNLRNELKELQTKESCSLFSCLYKSWSHSPVATVSLCYLTKNYRHACDLTMYFGNLDITVDFLKEIDKLVQLIESPIFSYLRLHMLNIEENQYLIKSLYALLMLLPQSEAFKLLHYRLQCLPHHSLNSLSDSLRPTPNTETRSHVKDIDFDELFQHFVNVQERHRVSKTKTYKSL